MTSPGAGVASCSCEVMTVPAKLALGQHLGHRRACAGGADGRGGKGCEAGRAQAPKGPAGGTHPISLTQVTEEERHTPVDLQGGGTR